MKLKTENLKLQNALAHLQKGQTAIENNNFEAALDEIEKARDVFESFESNEGLIVSYLWIALITLKVEEMEASDVEGPLRRACAHFSAAAIEERAKKTTFKTFTEDYDPFFRAYEMVVDFILNDLYERMRELDGKDSKEGITSILVAQNCCGLKKKLEAAYRDPGLDGNSGLLPQPMDETQAVEIAKTSRPYALIFPCATFSTFFVWGVLKSTRGVEIYAHREKKQLSEIQRSADISNFALQRETLKVLAGAIYENQPEGFRKRVAQGLWESELMRKEVPQFIKTVQASDHDGNSSNEPPNIDGDGIDKAIEEKTMTALEDISKLTNSWEFWNVLKSLSDEKGRLWVSMLYKTATVAFVVGGITNDMYTHNLNETLLCYQYTI